MPISIIVTDLGERKYDASNYIEISIFFKGVDQARLPAIAIIRQEFHIVDELIAKALIKIDVLKSNKIIIDFNINNIIFRVYKYIKIFI